ncbi:MAG: hypothetical protein ACTSVG_14635 [Alphaproteobacteria bacterium]
MQHGALQFSRFLLRPALFGLMLAVLIPAGPAIAGEGTAGVSAPPWQRLPADDEEAGFRPDSAGLRGLTGFGPVLREADYGAPWRGLFFHAGRGLRIGAEGAFDPGFGHLRAIVALKLDF